MNRIIFIDLNSIIRKREFSRNAFHNKDYDVVSMMFSYLKSLEIKDTDLVLVVHNTTTSWRKNIDSTYSFIGKELEVFYKAMLQNLYISTPFHIINMNDLEAKDIISYGCRHYKDKECIVISDDSIFDQLVAGNNVKIFSIKKKNFKVIFKNPYKIILSKVKDENNKLNFDKKMLINNLLTLPKNIEEKAEYALMNIDVDKEHNIENLKFESLKERFISFYNIDLKTKKLKEGQLVLN